MIIDSSAIVAILKQEPEAIGALRLISFAERCDISAGNYVEIGIVIDNSPDSELPSDYDELLGELEIEISPVTDTQARIARQAYRDFGRGSGHTAKLNYGDCFAYALAKETGRPLLYKGDDFFHAGFKRLV